MILGAVVVPDFSVTSRDYGLPQCGSWLVRSPTGKPLVFRRQRRGEAANSRFGFDGRPIISFRFNDMRNWPADCAGSV